MAEAPESSRVGLAKPEETKSDFKSFVSTQFDKDYDTLQPEEKEAMVAQMHEYYSKMLTDMKTEWNLSFSRVSELESSSNIDKQKMNDDIAKKDMAEREVDHLRATTNENKDQTRVIKQLEGRIRELQAPKSSGESQSNFLSQLGLLNKYATILQSRWRGYQQRKSFYSNLQKFATEDQQVSRKNQPDEMIMRQMLAAFAKKNLTLEEAFRGADVNSSGSVSCEDFLKFISKMNIGVTQAQTSRFLMILDEDFSGFIEQKEYYDALASYNVGSERHRSGARTFEQETLLKFTQVFERRQIEPVEIFNMCDVDGSGTISLKELQLVLEKMGIGFQKKEIHALLKILDTDQSGDIGRNEFCRVLNKGAQVFKIEAALGTNSIPEPIPTRTIEKAYNPETKRIVQKMESKGESILDIFARIETDKSGRMSIGAFTRSMGRWFPNLSREEMISLINEIDIDGNSLIDMSEIQGLVLKYCDVQPTYAQLLIQMAARVQSERVSTTKFFSNKNVPLDYRPNYLQFVEMQASLFDLTKEQSTQVFNSLDLKKSGEVEIVNLIAAIQAYRTDGQEDLRATAQKDQLLQEVEDAESSAAKRLESVNNLLRDNDLKPMMIWRLADRDKSGVVQVVDLQTALGKLSPSLPKSGLEAFAEVFPEKNVTRDGFAEMFKCDVHETIADAEGEKDKYGLSIPQAYWLNRLNDALKRFGVSKERLYDLSDTDGDNIVSTSDLTNGIKKLIGTQELGSMDILQVVKAFDQETFGFGYYGKRLESAMVTSHDPRVIASYARERERAKPFNFQRERAQAGDQNMPTLSPKKPKDENRELPFSFMPLGNSPSVKAIQKLIHALGQSEPFSYFSHDANLSPADTINFHHCIDLLTSIPNGLNRSEATILFNALDLTGNKVIYIYNLLAVLDTYEKDTGLIKMDSAYAEIADDKKFNALPVAYNEQADAKVRAAWKDVAKNLRKGVPLYRILDNKLSEKIENDQWDFHVKALLNIDQDMLLIRQGFPPDSRWYHIAIVLQSYLTEEEFCPQKLMISTLIFNKVRHRASEFFQASKVRIGSNIGAANLEVILEKRLKMFKFEIDQILRAVYSNSRSQRPVYYFYTYFDMALSTLQDGKLAHRFPVFPLPRSNCEPAVKEIFARCANSDTDSLPLENDLDLERLSLLIEGQASPEECNTIFRYTRMNQYPNIKHYHLRTIFAMHNLQVQEFPEFAVRQLTDQHRNQPSTTILKNFDIALTDLLALPILTKYMGSVCPQITELYNYLDFNRRGGIYGYQLATLIDIVQRNGGNLEHFPIFQNDDGTPEINKMIQSIANRIKPTSAYNFYIDQTLRLDDELSKQEFFDKFSIDKGDFTPKEVDMVFPALCMGRQKVTVYHYLSCLESYSLNPIQTPRVAGSHVLATRREQEAPASLIKLAGTCGKNDIAIWLQQSGLVIHEKVSWPKFTQCLAFAITEIEAKELYDFIDNNERGYIYVYQIAGLIDIISQSGGELRSYPIKQNKTTPVQLAEYFTRLEVSIDSNSLSFYDNRKIPGFDVKKALTYREFCQVLFAGEVTHLTHSIFQSVDVGLQRTVMCYAYLAVVESYVKIKEKLVRPEVVASTVPKEVVKFATFCRSSSSLEWLESEYNMTPIDKYTMNDFIEIFKILLPTETRQLFRWLDTRNLEQVMIYELATCVDIGKEGQFGKFPMKQNPDTPVLVRETIENMNVKGQPLVTVMNAFTSLKQSIQKQEFTQKLQKTYEVEIHRLGQLFDCLDFKQCGIVECYQIVACLDSYVSGHIQTAPTVSHMPLADAMAPFLSLVTPGFTTQQHCANLNTRQMLNVADFQGYMQHRFSMTPDLARQLFMQIDVSSAGAIFAYEFFTFFDSLRLKAEIPYKENGDNELLNHEARMLDGAERGTVDAYSMISPEMEVKLEGLLSLLDAHNRADVQNIFFALDMNKKGVVPFYYFLAVVENYRMKKIGSNVATGSKAAPPAPEALALTPLQDALIKLSEFINSGNQGHPFSSRDLFGMFDRNKDGFIATNELEQAIDSMKLDITSKQRTLLVNTADLDKSGFIEYEEFTLFLKQFETNGSPKKLQTSQGPPVEKPRRGPEKQLPRQQEPSLPGSIEPVFEMHDLENHRVSDFAKNSLYKAIYKMKEYAKSHEHTTKSLYNLLYSLDHNYSDTINTNELAVAIDRLEIGLTNNQKAEVKALAEFDREGNMSYERYVRYIYEYRFPRLEETKRPKGNTDNAAHAVLFPPSAKKEEQPPTQDDKPAKNSLVNKLKGVGKSATAPITDHHEPTPPPSSGRTAAPKQSLQHGNKSAIGILLHSQENLDAKQALERFESYKINPQTDIFNEFYPNCQTILNSEIAALKLVTQMLADSDHFNDPDFNPEHSGERLLYFTGERPTENFPNPADIKWRRPSEWLGADCIFCRKDLSSHDVIQGALGDCWLLSALSVLATRDELVIGGVPDLDRPSKITRESAINLSRGVYPPLFHCFAKKGLYVFRFFKNCAWRYVIIDDKLPILEKEGYQQQYIFAHCKDNKELWVPLIEKAYAKLHGCYQALSGGFIDEGLADLTGLVAQKLPAKEMGSTREGTDDLWQQLMTFKSEKTLLGCSVDGHAVESDIRNEDNEPTGLIAQHAYSIIDLLYVKTTKNRKGRYKLLRLRNPWGRKEWTGKWSDKSPELRANLEGVMREIKKLGEDEPFDPNDPENGDFLMSYRDWLTYFSNLYACIDFPDQWSGVRFYGAWTKGNAMGVPKGPQITQEDCKKWARNPQYLMKFQIPTEVFISLIQNDGRFDPNYQTKSICFTVMSLISGEKNIIAYDHDRVADKSKLRKGREVSIRTILDPGTYAVIPATENAKVLGKFYLSIYYNCMKDEAQFSSVEEPSDSGFIIEEEEEYRPEDISEEKVDRLQTFFSHLSEV